eukprot:2621767-Prymnesium_polylepis.1
MAGRRLNFALCSVFGGRARRGASVCCAGRVRSCPGLCDFDFDALDECRRMMSSDVDASYKNAHECGQ